MTRRKIGVFQKINIIFFLALFRNVWQYVNQQKLINFSLHFMILSSILSFDEMPLPPTATENKQWATTFKGGLSNEA